MTWQPGTVPVAPAPDLVPAIAQAVWRQTERALHQDLLPGYVTVEESSPVLRGRLRESVQLSARRGLPLPLEIRHDEFTVDIPENQILRAACARMLLVPRVDDESARMLRRLLREFSDVSEIPRGGPVPSWTPSRLNARYHDALQLASLVLAATAVEHGAGNVAVNGFLIDMPALFEQFVTVFLREALVAESGGRVEGQARYYFAQVVLRPDIVWQSGGAAAAVIDAKYKAEKPAGYPEPTSTSCSLTAPSSACRPATWSTPAATPNPRGTTGPAHGTDARSRAAIASRVTGNELAGDGGGIFLHFSS